HPEHRSGVYTLLLRRYPQRLAAVPGPVLDGFAVAEPVLLTARGIVEAVRYDPVRARVHSGHDAVMVRERLGREDGHQAIRAHARGREPVEVGRDPAVEIVVAESVERDQHDVRPL